MQQRRRHFCPFMSTLKILKWSLFYMSVFGVLSLTLLFLISDFCHHGQLAGKEPREDTVPKANKGDKDQSSLKDAVHPPPFLLANLSSSQQDELRGTAGLEPLPSENGSVYEKACVCTLLNDQPYRYLINEPDKCQDARPFLVMLITAAPAQLSARDAIRQTWGNEHVTAGLGFLRLFLLGRGNNTDGHLQQSIEEESRIHHDIIQQDYQDTYRNLTIKTLMGLYWLASHCPHAQYVMKTDSDMFVNTEYLVYKLLRPDLPPRQNYFTGYLMRGYAPNRDKNSKWYMPRELYPSNRYPVFCSGTGYVFSGDLAARIYNVSLSTCHLPLEDVYVGICLDKLHVVPVPPPNQFLFNNWRVSYSRCKYSQLITSHKFKPNALIMYWKHLQKNKHNPCNTVPKGKGNRKWQII